MKGFVGAKLYFDNKSKLVAKVEKVEGNKTRFTIVNGELLNQLKDDKLHVILVGVRPTQNLRMKLIMDYVETPIGKFICFKIMQTVEADHPFIGKKASTSITWIGKGLGVIKTESYNKKRKTVESEALNRA